MKIVALEGSGEVARRVESTKQFDRVLCCVVFNQPWSGKNSKRSFSHEQQRPQPSEVLVRLQILKMQNKRSPRFGMPLDPVIYPGLTARTVPTAVLLPACLHYPRGKAWEAGKTD